MTEENKTGNEKDTGDAGQTDTGNKDITAGGQQDVTPDAEGNQDEKYKAAVAMANAEKEKRQATESQSQLLQDQMSIMQANQVQPQQPSSTYEQAIKDLGIDPDYMTETERIKVFAHKEQLDQVKNQQVASQFANQQFIRSHPDYFDVVGKPVGNQYQVSAELQKILTEKPHLTAAAYASSQGAYQIVMEERKLAELKKKNEALTEHQTQQDIDNKTAPMSGAAAGGGGTVASGDVLPANATIEQVREMERRVAAGEFDK